MRIEGKIIILFILFLFGIVLFINLHNNNIVMQVRMISIIEGDNFYYEYTYNEMCNSFWNNRLLWKELYNRYKLSKG